MRSADTCRHYDPDRDFCRELKIITPRPRCLRCEHHESHNKGLGDAMESFISVATLGQGKRVAGAVAKVTKKKGGCGCGKRRATLNRLGDMLKGKGETDGD